jgi:hypothetical protein
MVVSLERAFNYSYLNALVKNGSSRSKRDEGNRALQLWQDHERYISRSALVYDKGLSKLTLP